MLIKRVVIQGFKTFAKRTEFLFDPGITAVVGPNGSGKSNIVDAVRWCLGEQSFGLLRSRKTSDVIFSGSDKKARLGMAQVSLTLDNSGGEIPLDFVEVEITRRAYRDGDNEYLVNGQKIRLQDVTQILAQTGLGKRTYAVIGQGLIDRVLSLAPEERRSLFEEAAGLTGYHARRESTMRRLDATHANLTRVRDITAELEPRLGALRRQAERAREREQHAQDLRGLLREWYGYRWHAALAEVEEHNAQASALQAGLEARQGELGAVATRIEALRARQTQIRSDLAESHREAAGLHREAETAGRELAIAQERKRQIDTRALELEAELVPLTVQQEALAGHLSGLESARGEAEAAVALRRGERAETESALAGILAQQQALRAAVEEHRRTVDAHRQRGADAQAHRVQILERRDTLEADARKRALALATAAAEAESAAREVRAAEAAFAALDTQAETVRAELTTVEANAAVLRKSLEEAELTRRQRDRDVDRMQTRLDLLRRLDEEGAGMAAGVRAVLQAGLPGMIGVVGALLRVPPELDRAIETALGAAMQNIVASTWNDAQQAIDYLKRQQRGRATFLPLDRLYTPAAIPAPGMEGVLGNAADLVACDDAIAETRAHLLNRIWVVRDLATARRALDLRGNGPRPTVVTLDGDIVRPGGAVSGGGDAGRRDDGSMLARARELRDLPGQVETARAASQAAATHCHELARQIAVLAAAQEGRQRALAEFARQERTQRATLEQVRRNADRAAQQVAFLEDQAASADADLVSLAVRLTALDLEIDAVRMEQAELAASLNAAEARATESAPEALLRELADRRAEEAAATGLLESRRALHLQQQQTLADLLGQIESRRTRRSQLAADASRIAHELEALGAREYAVTSRLATLQAAIEPLEARVDALQAEQESAEQDERRLQAAQRTEESAWAHLAVAVQRSEDAVNLVRADIERDLGLVTLEASEDLAYQPPLPIDAFVEQLPVREEVSPGLAEEMAALRVRLARLVNVNPGAPREYEEAGQRFEFLTAQADDLEAAAADLRKVIAELDQVMRSELTRTFDAVAVHFKIEFERLFNGGTAELFLTEPENIAESGIEIVARPPGKRPQNLALLSGGERSLAACALIFAILRVSPTPFCVLDEVDAALDEANVDRFRAAVEDLSAGTQFIIVTHNRRTLEGSNTIYGVTMGDDGVSRVISLRLEGGHIVHHHGPATGAAAAPEEGAPEDEADLSEIEEVVKM